MSLKSRSSQKTVSRNSRDLHAGPQFKRTARKHGNKIADKQAAAIALGQARKAGATGYGMRMT